MSLVINDYAEELGCDPVDVRECPECGMSQMRDESLMGVWGSREQHRCRYCGMGFAFFLSEEE